MFLMVFWFSSSAFLIRLGGFSPSSHFFLTISRSIELASKEGGNCNNVTRGEFSRWKSHDNNYPEPHPGQFDLFYDASLRQVPTWSRGTFSSYALVSLCICLSTHSSPYALVSLHTCLTVTSVYQPKEHSA